MLQRKESKAVRFVMDSTKKNYHTTMTSTGWPGSGFNTRKWISSSGIPSKKRRITSRFSMLIRPQETHGFPFLWNCASFFKSHCVWIQNNFVWSFGTATTVATGLFLALFRHFHMSTIWHLFLTSPVKYSSLWRLSSGWIMAVQLLNYNL